MNLMVLTSSWPKEAKYKRLHSVWFLLYDVLERENKFIVIEIRSMVA